MSIRNILAAAGLHSLTMKIPVFLLLLALANAKVFQRCEWARVLKDNGMDGYRGISLADCEFVGQYCLMLFNITFKILHLVLFFVFIVYFTVLLLNIC